MGIRSVITFYVKETPYVSVYQQYDGYPDGVGKDLCDWLSDKILINGISSNLKDISKYANGVGCLAAQFIRDFKYGVGNLYITPADYDREWIDFNYSVIINDDINLPSGGVPMKDIVKIKVSIFKNTETIFVGSIDEFYSFIEHYRKET